MSSEATSSSQSTPGHSRQHSQARRTALPRQTSSDPLQANDALVPSAAPASPAVRSPLATPAGPNAAGARAKHVPRTPSKSPGVRVVDQAPRNFSFLLKHENFHPMSEADVPVAFKDLPRTPKPDSTVAGLLEAGFFRAAAELAARELKAISDPTDHARIFALLYARLTSLELLGFHFEAAQEVKALQDLNGAFYRDPVTGIHLAPWELRLLVVRLQAVGFGDWRRGVISYYDLAREARFLARRIDERQLWSNRLLDLALRVGNALVEMGDLEGAVRHLRTIQDSKMDQTAKSHLALLFLRAGDAMTARQVVTAIENTTEITDNHIIEALSQMADGDYSGAESSWTAMKAATSEDTSTNAMIIQNLAICLIYLGRVEEARSALEGLVNDGHTIRALVFNLATVFDLTSESSKDLKLALSEKVAAQPPSSTGIERANADFKL